MHSDRFSHSSHSSARNAVHSLAGTTYAMETSAWCTALVRFPMEHRLVPVAPSTTELFNIVWARAMNFIFEHQAKESLILL